MIGYFLTRGLVMVFGYAYPAYECYKTVEQNKPEIEQLRFWCQYWILVAFLTVCERIGDAFVSWVPMYSEAKLAFFIYLWYPKTRGTTYVYDSFFTPYVAKHEHEIDRNLLELRARAGDIAFLNWQRAASYVQTRIFGILQYVAAQSTPSPRPSQNPHAQGGKPLQPSQGADRQPATRTRRQPPDRGESSSDVSSTASSLHQKEVAEEVGPSQASKLASSEAASSTRSANASYENASEEVESVLEPKQSETVPPPGETAGAPPKETVMEETIRVTRVGWGKLVPVVADR